MKNDIAPGLTILDGAHFSWQVTYGEAAASTVGLPTSGVLPRAFAVRSHRTGAVKVFDLSFVDSKPEETEETAVFTERNPTNPSAPLTVYIGGR
ncbi:MAG: hypothetical protein EBT79_14815 [Actinobacteria bacterium]|nr:hypothetical protein [Actinomycetota bacterium]